MEPVPVSSAASANNNKEFPSGPFKFSLAGATAAPASRPKLIRPRGARYASGSASITECMMTNAAAAPPAPPPKAAVKPASDVFAGALARAAAQSTIHPLDTLKVRMQTANGGAALPGISKFGRLVPPAGGFLVPIAAVGQSVASLYKGVLGAASGAGIAIGAYFAFYGAACNTFNKHTDWPAGVVAFVSGGVAAAGSSVVKVPLAVCIRSVQAGIYPNFAAAATSIVAAAGPRGLFTGYAPTLLEDVPDMAFKFACYESMRNLHIRLNRRQPSPQEDFTMGALAGALAAAATTPLDVIKTNMMCSAASRPTMVSAARTIFAQGGMNAMFRGVGARAVSNGINSAVFFCFFESLRGFIADRNAAKQRAAAAGGAQALAGEEFEMHVKPLVIDVGFGEENLSSNEAVASI